MVSISGYLECNILVSLLSSRQTSEDMLIDAAMVLHVGGFLATIIILGAFGTHIPAETALLEFSDLGGWSSMGLALMVGYVSS